MISMTCIKSATGASKYMTEQNAVEYYADEKVPSQWHGAGAEFQGLAGREVTAEELTRQLQGKVTEFNSHTGHFQEKQLGVTRNGEMQHRAGWDMAFAAPKSVSIESEVYGNKDVRTAHENAVLKAMDFLQSKAAQTRINGEFVPTNSLTYATFQHATSRAGDPQTHTHCIVANVTYHNGKAYSLSNEKVMDYRTTADAVYKNELANSLERMGYAVQYDSKGNFELTGYSKEQLDSFSKRNEEIKQALAERGENKATASHAARQAAALDTRNDKNHPESAIAHRERWQAEAKLAGIEAAKRGHTTAIDHHNSGREAVAASIRHLTEREMAFSEKDLYKHSAQFSQGKATLSDIESSISEFLKSGELLQREDGKFTTRDALQSERQMESRLIAGHGAHRSVMSDKEFDTALSKFERSKGFALSDEQRAAARMILTGHDRFQGVQGLAGTGKTTMLEYVREAAESKGWEVKGFSNGAAQAEKLQQESGIKSDTTSRFLSDQSQTARDAELAQKAVETHGRCGGVFGIDPNWKALERGVKDGSVQKDYDTAGRAFYSDRRGETFTRGLYDKTTEIRSPNVLRIPGISASETKYIITNKGVFKTGSGSLNEVATRLRDNVREATRDRGAMGKAADWAAEKILSKAENWHKCSAIEAAAVRTAAAADTLRSRSEELSSLKTQAAQVGTERKTLFIQDESSMSGQREFNRVLEATEKAGARAVFLGDEKQHQAVEAGKAFELAKAHMPTSELGQDSIRRQTTEHAKDAVSKILEGRQGDAMRSLETREVRNAQQAVMDKYKSMGELNPQQKTAERTELKEAAKQDNKAVISELAKDYSKLDKQIRDNTQVITSTNADKNAINSSIRDELKANGELHDGKRTTTYQKTDHSAEELKQASAYEKGQKVEFNADYKSIGVAKGERGEVAGVDSRTNNVNLKMEDGRSINFNPEKVQGREVFNQVHGKEFSPGDRVGFNKNDRDLDVRNGQTGTVQDFDGKNMRVKMDSGETRQINTEQYRHIDHAYASTSFKSQGQTYDKAMLHHNTEAGRHGDRETYVNVTRAREDIKVYTQNSEKAAIQSGQRLDKESATGLSRGKGLTAGTSKAKLAKGSATGTGKTKLAKGSKLERTGGR